MSTPTNVPDVKALKSRISALEQRNHKLFELATVGLVDLGATGRIIGANRVFLDTLKVSRNDTLDRPFLDFVTLAERETVAKILAPFFSGNETTDSLFLCRFVRPSGGSEIPLIVHVEQETSQALGRSLRLEVADIGASMLFGRKLLENDHDYLRMVSNLPIPIFRRNADNLFIFANAAYLEHLDCTWEEIKNKSDFDIFDHELAKQYAADDGKVLDCGETVQKTEKHRVRRDPEPYWVYVIKSPVFAADGRITGLQGAFWIVKDPKMFAAQLHDEVLTDISKRLQEDVFEKEALYHSLLEIIPAFIFIKDLASRFKYVNAAFATLVGRQAKEIIGKDDFDLFDHGLAKQYQNDDQEVFSSKRAIKRVERNQSQTRGSMIVEVIKAPLFDVQGEITGLACVFWDITVVREFEDIIKFIVHDIKSLIARIEANLLLVQDQIGDAANLGGIVEPLSLLKKVVQKTRRLGLLQPQDVPEPVDLNEISQVLIDVIKDKRFSVEPTTSSTVILANRSDVVSALLELVGNSLRAVSKSDGRVRVSFVFDQETGTIQVEDNGPGLHDPLPTSRGLGLAFVKYVTKKYLGSFEIRNRSAGRGAIARISFPLKPCDKEIKK